MRTNVQEVIDKIENELRSKKLFAELVDYTDGTSNIVGVKYLIEWGDWKHEHLRFDWIMRELFGNKLIQINEEVSEEDGSDCYSAYHYIFVET